MQDPHGQKPPDAIFCIRGLSVKKESMPGKTAIERSGPCPSCSPDALHQNSAPPVGCGQGRRPSGSKAHGAAQTRYHRTTHTRPDAAKAAGRADRGIPWSRPDALHQNSASLIGYGQADWGMVSAIQTRRRRSGVAGLCLGFLFLHGGSAHGPSKPCFALKQIPAHDQDKQGGEREEEPGQIFVIKI